MTEEFSGYPDWLSRNLLSAEFPWHLAQFRSIADFLHQYKLAGCRWIGLFSDVAYSQTATLVLDWDRSLLPDKLQARLLDPTRWLFLVVQLEQVDQISCSGYEDLLPGVKLQRTVATAEYMAIDGKQLFAVEDQAEGVVAIVFRGDAAVLAIDESGRSIGLI
jgi:hypothetical protein